MEKVRPPRWYGQRLKIAGVKGYSSATIRRWLERRVIEQVIPQRNDQIRRWGKRRLDWAACKGRARVGTGYDKLSSSLLPSSTSPSSAEPSSRSPRTIRQTEPGHSFINPFSLQGGRPPIHLYSIVPFVFPIF